MKLMNFRALTAMLMFLASGVIFSSCNKMNDNDDNNAAVAGVMGFNMAPDQDAIVMTLDGNAISNSPLGYNNYTGMYVAVYAGNRTFRTYNVNGSIPLTETGVSLDTNKYYSVYFLGTSGNYKHVFAEDKFDEMSGSNGKAYIRYIQAITDSTPSRVRITGGGNTWVDEDAGYSQTSAFVAVDPGELNIDLSNSADVDVSRTITVEAKKVYTILFMGISDSNNPELAEQIKFVTNGSLAD